MDETSIRSRGKVPRVTIETLAKDFEAGMRPNQIAAKHGMSPTCVRTRLNGWKPGCIGRRHRHQQYDALLMKYAASNEKRMKRIERNQAIAAEAVAGRPFREISREFGVCDSFVAWIAYRAGVQKRRTCTRERDTEWLAMHKRGLTVKQIAERVGRPWATVREGVARARDGYVFRQREYDR